jgi:hypothetical protein
MHERGSYERQTARLLLGLTTWLLQMVLSTVLQGVGVVQGWCWGQLLGSVPAAYSTEQQASCCELQLWWLLPGNEIGTQVTEGWLLSLFCALCCDAARVCWYGMHAVLFPFTCCGGGGCQCMHAALSPCTCCC